MAHDILVAPSSAMVVNNLSDHDSGNPRLVNPAGIEHRQRLMGRAKDESRGAPKVEGVVAGAVASKPVKPPWSAADVCKRRRCRQNAQPSTKDSPLFGAEAANA